MLKVTPRQGSLTAEHLIFLLKFFLICLRNLLPKANGRCCFGHKHSILRIDSHEYEIQASDIGHLVSSNA